MSDSILTVLKNIDCNGFNSVYCLHSDYYVPICVYIFYEEVDRFVFWGFKFRKILYLRRTHYCNGFVLEVVLFIMKEAVDDL